MMISMAIVHSILSQARHDNSVELIIMSAWYGSGLSSNLLIGTFLFPRLCNLNISMSIHPLPLFEETVMVPCQGK